MNCIFIFMFLVVSSLAYAELELFNDLDSTSSAEVIDKKILDRSPQAVNEKTKFGKPKKVKSSDRNVAEKNLPVDQIPQKTFKKYTGSISIYPKNPSKTYLKGVKTGDFLVVKLDQKLIGYTGSKIPARARVDIGEHRGALLYGHASMSDTTKRLLLNFKTLTLPNGDQFEIDADILSPDGSLGLIGEIYSNKLELFGLDLIFSAFKGYAEASKEREANLLGQEYAKSNEANAEKGAISEASQASINRIRNEFLKSDEFVTTKEMGKAIVIVNNRPFKK